MPKQLQTPRFEVDYSTRLAQQREARDRKLGKKVFWVMCPPPEPNYPTVAVGASYIYRILYDELYGWEKRMLSDQEVTLLVLQGYRIKDYDPAFKYYYPAAKNKQQLNSLYGHIGPGYRLGPYTTGSSKVQKKVTTQYIKNSP
jgi:hypothetical protein